jgi:PKD repeat protein
METNRLKNTILVAEVAVFAGILGLLVMAIGMPLNPIQMPSGAYPPRLANGTANSPLPLAAPVELPPDTLKADFTWTDPAVSGNLAVQFYDRSTGSPIGYYWNFGDGKEAKERNPVHVYQTSRVYHVKLTVVNATHSYDTIVRDISL